MNKEQEILEVGKGAIQSPEDYRYVNVEHLAGAAPAAVTFPPSFHIDYSKVPDLYQRKIGACTAHAAVEVVTKREHRLTGAVKKYSPRFPYTMSKIEDGLVDKTEQGTFPVMPLKMGVKYGFATETTMPNDTTLSFDEYIYHRNITNIPQAAFAEASENRIPGYAQVGKFYSVSEAQLKQALINSQDGVKTCLPVGTEWWTAADGRVSWAAGDILPIRKMVTLVSGHDIVVTGWDMEGVRCKVYFRNHWSIDWANQDNGWFYLDDHTLTEAWMVSEIPDPLLAIIRSLPNQNTFHYTWLKDMAPKDQGIDITMLQIALKIMGTFPFTQQVTAYFGEITRGAVIEFQKKYAVASASEIVAAAGKVGPKTRAALNKIFTQK